MTIFLSKILLLLFCALFCGIARQTPENFTLPGYFLTTKENQTPVGTEGIDANPQPNSSISNAMAIDSTQQHGAMRSLRQPQDIETGCFTGKEVRDIHPKGQKKRPGHPKDQLML
ncbi:MAG TPA: hypothetical protein DHW36_15935 [Thalassospira sp.]|nr:hypothetical protein [Thalassospira sp.]HCK20004.1 hypothetical protein [Thalassospira sp.]